MSSLVKNAFPLQFPWKTQDPFLFCAYHEDRYPRGNEDLGPVSSLEGRNIGQDFEGKDGWRMYHGTTVPGFPAHPHRGFETVTIVQQGLVDHADSLGAGGRFGNGDVQWMTAGKGIQHSEMFPLLNQTSENPFVLFQLWLNLPQVKKLTEPYYGMLWHEDIPKIELVSAGKKAIITLIAGSFHGKNALKPNPDSWAADPTNEVAIWTIQLDPGINVTIPGCSNEVNRSLFCFKGDHFTLGDQRFLSEMTIELNPEEFTIKNGDDESHFLFLQGKPINEPVAQYGPFVMNYEGEIRDAMKEFQLTQFGGWPWPKPDHVHSQEATRFAKYADGKVEYH